MKDAKKKRPRPQARGELSLGWQLFFITAPEFWIPGLIAFVSLEFFGIPEELGLAVFVVSLVVLLMLASVVAVYLFGRSLKRGRTGTGGSDKRRR